MSHCSKAEYLLAIRGRYLQAKRVVKKNILDEFCVTCGYHRKYAIRLLQRRVGRNSPRKRARPGRKKRYDHPLILQVLKTLWVAANLPCSKRLKAIIPLWLPFYEPKLPKDIVQHLPSVKLVAKERVGSKTIKKYDAPQTPVQRLLNSNDMDQGTKQLLRTQIQTLNPFHLQKQVVHKIKAILRGAQAQ